MFHLSETFVVENIRCKYRQIMQYLIFELHSRIAPSIGRPTEHEHDKETVAYIRISIKTMTKEKIKRLLKPAYSCYGLSLYWFLGLVDYRYGWLRFMWTFKNYGINFLLFFGSCVIIKLVYSSWWELEKKLCGLEVGWAGVIRQTVSFLSVCVGVFVGRRVGWVGIIRHQMLL